MLAIRYTLICLGLIITTLSLKKMGDGLSRCYTAFWEDDKHLNGWILPKVEEVRVQDNLRTRERERERAG